MILTSCSALRSSWSSSILVLPAGVLWPLELHLEPLHADLEAVHGLDGGLRARRVVEAHEPEALALVGGPVDEDLGADDVPKGEEHLH